MTEDLTRRFEALVARPDAEVPLDEAAIVLAAHAIPGLDIDDELARLDDLAVGVATPTVDGVRTHLVEHLGFAGDQATYHDTANSLLPAVLDRRQGIPITLAVVAMEVGRRRGVTLEGIGMPGHFLVRAADDLDRYLDLFHGGAFLDEDACAAVFAQLHPDQPWDPRYLQPVGPQAILTRMLTNLAGAQRRAGDRRGLCWSLDLRLRLPGATDRDRRELAVVLGAAGRYTAAATALEAIGSERDQVAAQRMRARLN